MTWILAAVIVALLLERHLNERAWRQERGDLCQRIQAPEVAVAQHDQSELVEAPLVSLDDDDAYWGQVNGDH